VVLKGKQQQLEIMLGPNWRSLVMWSPNPLGTGKGSNALSAGAGRAAQPPAAPPAQATRTADPNFICFEPMAGISNALNLAQAGKYKELQYVQPGGTWQESFWIKPSGF
jgi:aldose 1-epimerase